MSYSEFLSILASLSGGYSSYLWLKSSRVKYLPSSERFNAPPERVDMNPPGRAPGTYVGGVPTATTDEIQKYVVLNGKMNASAAGMSALAAALSAMAAFLSGTP